MQLTILGTSCMVPTKERNVQAIYLDYNGEGILVDCGEGTQRQMNIANIKRNKVKKILISHWHGDHVSGLIGLIQTIGNEENPQALNIYGPQGTKERIEHLIKAIAFNNKVELKIHELDPNNKILTFFENNDYALECINLRHTIPTLGFSFIEKDVRKINMAKAQQFGLRQGPLIGKLQKGESIVFKEKKITPELVSTLKTGKKITFILDTEQNKNVVELARDADLLIIEATYISEKEEKAALFKHLTAKQAALIANQANAKKMIMTHFSQRYKTTDELLDEARTYFPESQCAYDFMKIKV